MALVRDSEVEQAASGDAFDAYIAAKRIARGKLSVVDPTL